jgi:GxxExxY protein
MNAEKKGLMHEPLTDQVLRGFYDVYNQLGHGFLENVYEAALQIALSDLGLKAERQMPITVRFRGQCVGEYRADMVVEDVLILEIKSQAALSPVNEAQLLNYLKATGMPVGLLLNFGPKPQFKRRVLTTSNPLPIRVDPRQSVADHVQ